jgi:hypothetical protein
MAQQRTSDTPVLYTVVDRPDDKLLAWGTLKRPSIAEVLSALEKEYPGVPHDQLFVQDLLITKSGSRPSKMGGRQKKTENPE